MIIDYDFRGKRVVITGGGHETARKMRAFIDAGATVSLVGPSFDKETLAAARKLRVRVVRCRPSEIGRHVFESADAVVVVAEGRDLGRRLQPAARRRHVLFYAGDDPEWSDWIQPAVRFDGPISVAVSTGGESPIVARALADRLVHEIQAEDRLEVRIQADARAFAQRRIASPEGRRAALNAVHEDPRVRAALAKGKFVDARDRARRVILSHATRTSMKRIARTTRAP